MGLCTHVFEAEFIWDNSNVSLAQVRNAIQSELESRAAKGYELISDGATIFRRPGSKHNGKHAYRGGIERNTDLSIFATFTTPRMKFVDDCCWTFSDDPGEVYVKTLSCSRIGEGDFYQNKRNIQTIMKEVIKRVGKPKITNVIRT